MSDHSVEGPGAPRTTGVVDVDDVDEAVARLDRVSCDPSLSFAERAVPQQAALRLAIDDRRTTEAWRRYRSLAIGSALEPGLLAGHVAALGDLAVDLEDDAALSRARVELSRLLAIARKRPDSPRDARPDWAVFAAILRTWDRPDVLRAERAFEASVRAWLAQGGAGRPGLRETLEAMAAEARRTVADGAADIALDGRRAFRALSILAGERNDVEAAWVQYDASAHNMDPVARATGLLAIARALDPHRAQANLLIPVVRELDRFVRDWPRPSSRADTRALDALRPAIVELADRLRPR